MRIVELHEVRNFLNYEDDSNDLSLVSLISAAECVIKNKILDNFETGYPSDIRQATLLLVEYWYQHKNTKGIAPLNGNYLPEKIQTLLNSYLR